MITRFYIDPETRLLHIYNHNVQENVVEDDLRKPGEDRPGKENSRIAIGQKVMILIPKKGYSELKMPDTAEIDDIMYRLYVIDKVRKGREAVKRGEVVSIEELKKEIESW